MEDMVDFFNSKGVTMLQFQEMPTSARESLFEAYVEATWQSKGEVKTDD